jgi:peroxiredoxin Q/BCP
MAIKVGDVAPDFALNAQNGSQVKLSNFRGTRNVVLYFYPKDDTPGCTKEACAFRDKYLDFQNLSSEILGISGDSTGSHQQFATKYNLPFTLLSDQDNAVRKLYGVPSTLFVLPGRVTYVIDKEGIVRLVYDSMLDFDAHVEEAMRILKTFA